MDSKITFLETYLSAGGLSYADSFKADIAIVLGEFEPDNPNLAFLDRMSSEQDIIHWVNALTSRIVLKHDEEDESVGEFVREYIANNS
jgi:hypothetical protein